MFTGTGTGFKITHFSGEGMMFRLLRFNFTASEIGVSAMPKSMYKESFDGFNTLLSQWRWIQIPLSRKST